MHRTRALSFAWLALGATIASCQDPVYANHVSFEINGDERTQETAICIPIGEWPGGGVTSTGGGRADGDLTFDLVDHDDALFVDIFSQEQLLEHREYSEKQLRSGKRDQFTVMTAAGRTVELNYWGSDKCEIPLEP